MSLPQHILKFVPGFAPPKRRGGPGACRGLMTNDHQRQLDARPGVWAALRTYAEDEKNHCQTEVSRLRRRWVDHPYDFDYERVVEDQMPGWAVFARRRPEVA